MTIKPLSTNPTELPWNEFAIPANNSLEIAISSTALYDQYARIEIRRYDLNDNPTGDWGEHDNDIVYDWRGPKDHKRESGFLPATSVHRRARIFLGYKAGHLNDYQPYVLDGVSAIRIGKSAGSIKWQCDDFGRDGDYDDLVVAFVLRK